MSLADNHLNTAHRSLSKESTSLRTSLSQTKVNKSYLKPVREDKNPEINKSLMQSNSKTQNLLNPIILRVRHKRTNSDKVLEKGIPINATKDFDEVCEKFLSRVDRGGDIELKVSFLIEFLRTAASLSFDFRKLFLKLSEIVREYQNYVKSLDSTRVEKQDLHLDIKNVIFHEKKVNEIRFKPSLKVTKRDESNKSNNSHDSSCSDKEHFPRLSGIKQLPISKNEDIEIQQKIPSVQSKVPQINLDQSEKIDFHAEFMSHFPEFSDSWREDALKLINK